jgi:hypothetical protein
MPAPDHSDITAIEKRMKEAARKLHAMSANLGMALTVIEFNSERRKALLARFAATHLRNGESAISADTLARADAGYDVEFQALLGQYQDAITQVKEYEIEKISWDTARSLLARQRVTLETMPETEA